MYILFIVGKLSIFCEQDTCMYHSASEPFIGIAVTPLDSNYNAVVMLIVKSCEDKAICYEIKINKTCVSKMLSDNSSSETRNHCSITIANSYLGILQHFLLFSSLKLIYFIYIQY